jgi:hypothetical protein
LIRSIAIFAIKRQSLKKLILYSVRDIMDSLQHLHTSFLRVTVMRFNKAGSRVVPANGSSASLYHEHDCSAASAEQLVDIDFVRTAQGLHVQTISNRSPSQPRPNSSFRPLSQDSPAQTTLPSVSSTSEPAQTASPGKRQPRQVPPLFLQHVLQQKVVESASSTRAESCLESLKSPSELVKKQEPTEVGHVSVWQGQNDWQQRMLEASDRAGFTGTSKPPKDVNSSRASTARQPGLQPRFPDSTAGK